MASWFGFSVSNFILWGLGDFCYLILCHPVGPTLLKKYWGIVYFCHIKWETWESRWIFVPSVCPGSRNVSAGDWGTKCFGSSGPLTFGFITIYSVIHRNQHCFWLKYTFVTEPEQNWEAVDGSQTETEKKHFFINICHRVLQADKARGCPEDAAVCAVGELCPEGRSRWWFSRASSWEWVRRASCGSSKPPLSIFT